MANSYPMPVEAPVTTANGRAVWLAFCWLVLDVMSPPEAHVPAHARSVPLGARSEPCGHRHCVVQPWRTGDWRRMNSRDSALAIGGSLIGAALVARAFRHRRALDLQGRTALITGGSRGLGLAIARELGRLGSRVTIAA